MFKLWRHKVTIPQWGADTAFAIAAIAFGLAFLYGALELPRLRFGDPVGPRVFPIMVGSGIVLLGVVLLVQKLTIARIARIEDDNTPVQTGYPFAIALVAAIIAIYFAVFHRIGFVPTSIAFILVIASIFNPGRWFANIATAVIFPTALYIIFTQFLGLRLAPGIMPF